MEHIRNDFQSEEKKRCLSTIYSRITIHQSFGTLTRPLNVTRKLWMLMNERKNTPPKCDYHRWREHSRYSCKVMLRSLGKMRTNRNNETRQFKFRKNTAVQESEWKVYRGTHLVSSTANEFRLEIIHLQCIVMAQNFSSWLTAGMQPGSWKNNQS